MARSATRGLTAAFLLLAAEAALLTPMVEFRSGVFASLASGRLSLAILAGMAVVVLLAERRPNRARLKRRPRSLLLNRLIVQLVTFNAFLAWTVWLSLGSETELGTRQAVVWMMGAALVAATAVDAFFPLASLGPWLLDRKLELSAAIAVGAGLYLLMPAAQSAWRIVGDPVCRFDSVLLYRLAGRASYSTSAEGLPVLGDGRIRLLVTPDCSELRSVLAFVLLGVTVLVARWGRIRWSRFTIVALAGPIALFLVLAGRLLVLLWVGAWLGASAAVQLAHSQASALVLLVASTMAWRWVIGPPLESTIRPAAAAVPIANRPRGGAPEA